MLGGLAIVLDIVAIRLPGLGFFSCGPAALAAMALVPAVGPVQAWVALVVGLLLRTLLNGLKSWPEAACDLFSHGLCLAVLSLIPGTVGLLALVPAFLADTVMWRLVAATVLEGQLSRKERAAWTRVQNWISQHQLAMLCLAPVLVVLVTANPLYALFALPLLGGLYRAVQAELLRLQVIDAEALQQSERRSRKELETVATTLQQTQQTLQLKALSENVLWELGKQLFQSKRLDTTSTIALEYITSRIHCDSAAVVLLEDGRPVIKAVHTGQGPFAPRAAPPSLNMTLFERAWREQKTLTLESTSPDTPCPGHPFVVIYPLGSEGVLYCGKINAPLETRGLRGGFTPEEYTLMGNVAGQAALGLQSARLFEEQQRTLAGLSQSAKIAAVGQLAAGLAHELNTPLGAIALQMDLAKQRINKPEQATTNLESAFRSLEHAQQILKRLLYYSREGSQANQRLDLNQLVKDTVSFLGGSFAQQGVTISVETQMIGSLEGNANELQQVLVSLLLNARDACLAPLAQGKTIRILTSMVSSRRCISILDDGPGIPAEIMDRIFEPFFTTRPIGQGTGLGLSLALKIVQAHNGKLTGRNRPGRPGAEFLIEF